MIGANDSAVTRRQQDSLRRWRLREAEKTRLKTKGVTYTESKNVGVVYVETGAGAACYRLVSGRWSVGYPATKQGVGVDSLLRFMRAADV